MRTIIDLDERDRADINALAQSLGIGPDALIKEAVREFLIRNRQASRDEAVTIWFENSRRKLSGVEEKRGV